jgi:transposase
MYYVIKFVFLIVIFRASNFIFVDESGLNRYYRREMGRAKRGVKVQDKKTGQRFSRTNIIAGVCGTNHLAVRCYNQSTTADFFEEWFEWELLSVVPEGSVIVMDNASFHKKNKLHEIAAKYNVFVLFLPPYSPEFNPIEKSWANLKRWLKDNISHFPSLEFAVEWYFDLGHS